MVDEFTLFPDLDPDAARAEEKPVKPAAEIGVPLPGSYNRPRVVYGDLDNRCFFDGCRGPLIPKNGLFYCDKCRVWFIEKAINEEI